jgi:hypothetical protein
LEGTSTGSFTAGSRRVHAYDDSRFGSQQHLLEALKLQKNSDKSLSELLDSFLQ